MKDIEELKKDDLFSLNSNGGFIPNLVTVSEDRIMDHTEYEVMELPHYNTGGGRSVTGFNSPRRGGSNSNNSNKDTSRDVDGTIANDCNGNNFDMESDSECVLNKLSSSKAHFRILLFYFWRFLEVT